MERLLICHIIAFSLGCFLDAIIGDPSMVLHPVVAIGKMIDMLDKAFMEKRMEQKCRKIVPEKIAGIITVSSVCLLTVFVSLSVCLSAYKLSLVAGIIVESILTSFGLAAKSLKRESMKVYYPLKNKDIESARFAVSMIVGRDTKDLAEEGIIKAAVETIAENTSDGVVAPMLYFALFGPAGGFFYKAVNTCDSMIGYKNERYKYFGYAAAKLDDILNFIPARISALLMIISASLIKGFDGKGAIKIFRRDRYNHKSPNSAQTESVCAGALSIRLAGPASYFGQIVEKPYIGDDIREIETEDIKRANCLMMATTVFSVLLCEIIMTIMLVIMTYCV